MIYLLLNFRLSLQYFVNYRHQNLLVNLKKLRKEDILVCYVSYAMKNASLLSQWKRVKMQSSIEMAGHRNRPLDPVLERNMIMMMMIIMMITTMIFYKNIILYI